MSAESPAPTDEFAFLSGSPKEIGTVDLVSAAVGEPSDDDKSTRLVIFPTKTERALLDKLMEDLNYPSQRALMFDALRELNASVRIGGSSVGSLLRLEHNVEVLTRSLEEDRVLFDRLLWVIGAYQRSFLAFTILHDSKAVLEAADKASPVPPAPAAVPAPPVVREKAVST